MIGNASARDNHSAVIEHYAQLAGKYDRKWDRYTRATLSKLLSRIDLNQTRRVLDVACGTGRLTAMLRENDPSIEVTGLDISPEMIAVARRNVGEGDGIAWDVAPAESLPVDDDAFDVVTCANAFHLVPDQEKAMKEFRRVLRPGGRVIIVDWCREFPTVWMLLRFSRLFGKQYRRVLTVEELASLLEDNGFDVARRERFKATRFWGLMCVIGTARSAQSDRKNVPNRFPTAQCRSARGP